MSNFTIHGAMDHHHVCLRRPLCITGRASSAHLQMSKTGRILFSVCIDQLFFLPPTCTCSLFSSSCQQEFPKKLKILYTSVILSLACVYLSLKMTNQSNVIDVRRQMLLVNIVPVQEARCKRQEGGQSMTRDATTWDALSI